MSTLEDLYEQDLYAWAMKNAELIRRGELGAIDGEHIAEELESMGKSQRRALRSRLAVLLAHLVKWQHQPQLRSRSWKSTIRVQRLELQELLDENPSLVPTLPEAIAGAYVKARLLAAGDTGVDEAQFPGACPFSPEQALDPDFWP